MADVTPKEKRSFHRSPNYPSSNLPEAIAKVRMIYEKERRAGAPRNIVLKHMGYNSINGASLRALSTLRKFGLIEERDGRIYVSQLSLDILVYPSTDERHKVSVVKSALKPSIYAHILERYQGGLPSDETIKAELVREYGFNDSVVETFLADFKATLEYVELETASSIIEMSSNSRNETIAPNAGLLSMKSSSPILTKQPVTMMTPTAFAPAVASANTFPIPLRKQNQAMLSFARMPLEKSDLELLKKWIDLMEENLTEALPQEDHNADV